MNILIKLMSIVSLVIAPTLAQLHGTGGHKQNIKVTIEQKIEADGDKEVKMENPFLEALQKDGLIDTRSFKVNFKNDSLTINDQLQTKETLDKYRSFLNGKTELNMEVNFTKQ